MLMQVVNVSVLGPVTLPEFSREFQNTMTKFGVFRAFIAGSWIDFGSYMPVKSPINGEAIAQVSKLGAEHVDSAIERLHYSWPLLKAIPAHKRADMLIKVADFIEEYKQLFRDVLIIEGGKPINEAEGEVESTITRLRMIHQDLGRLLNVGIPGEYGVGTENKYAIVVREPIGVVAAIAPFNYPLFTSMVKVATALLAGNPVIFKPSSYTPITGVLIAKAIEYAGLGNYFAMVTGPGAAVGDAMVTHPLVRAITLTGSTETGLRVMRMAGLKRLQLELGGKAPAIVLEDADLRDAARKIVTGSLRLSGQRCDAISRVIAMDSVADELINYIVKEVNGWVVGDPRDPKVRVGPLIDANAVERVHSMVDDALMKDGKLIYGGKYWLTYHEPTVVDNVSRKSRLAIEETFGPVIPVIRVKSVDEAIEVANEVMYGLDAAVFGRDVGMLWRVARSLEVGEVTINDFPRHGLGLFPFGGVKESGFGREGVGFSVEDVTELKTIVITHG
ncbi:aldehyde dehydrogenase [Vulcanisaeta souniana JCM 11219]|uniref:Aldehyde dehydrogenase n=2 Tax=Vulcanisaeta souniana TaxID=164452 RepID=A0A830EHW5_9CREN|nr:aldehyde dehydrogenase [Vulcanisaeta souniana JCM 11219]GGI78225.1 aldehyde dehydrogenase [Vulcanisaeta souniana JCM 11219]